MKIINFIITAFAVSATLSAGASEWVKIQHGDDKSISYEASLIDERGFLSKDFTVWLKATREFIEEKCGNLQQRTNQDFAETLRISSCMRGNAEKTKEEIYKISFNCDKKNINYSLESSVNIYGNTSKPSLRIGSYPGSLGYSLIEHYCK